MESQCRPNVDGVHNGVESHVKVVEKPRSVGSSSEFVLRILGLLLTLIAAVVAGVDKQTKIIPLTLIKTLPSLHVPVTAKWSDMSAFVYLVVSNAIACSYAAISLVLVTMLGRRGKGGRVLAVIVLDLHMVGLLFSANGAATAVGVLGQYGNSHVEWKKVCNVFDSFCDHLVASLALSFLGSLSFLGLVLLAILNLHKKSSTK
ncbi:hypothetical protein AAG906_034706 [Vitis piasezkii]